MGAEAAGARAANAQNGLKLFDDGATLIRLLSSRLSGPGAPRQW
jgi:hypothetical protein